MQSVYPTSSQSIDRALTAWPSLFKRARQSWLLESFLERIVESACLLGSAPFNVSRSRCEGFPIPGFPDNGRRGRFHGKRDTAPLLVHLENRYRDLLTHLDHLPWIFDEIVRKFAHMDQPVPVDPDIHESTKSCDVRHNSGSFMPSPDRQFFNPLSEAKTRNLSRVSAGFATPTGYPIESKTCLGCNIQRGVIFSRSEVSRTDRPASSEVPHHFFPRRVGFRMDGTVVQGFTPGYPQEPPDCGNAPGPRRGTFFSASREQNGPFFRVTNDVSCS